jgi:excisionase family DNA binding protein
MPQLLKTHDVQKLLGCSTITIYRMIESGHLPAPMRLSRRDLRWEPEVIERWLAERRVAADTLANTQANNMRRVA